jgi:hypothetical protein
MLSLYGLLNKASAYLYRDQPVIQQAVRLALNEMTDGISSDKAHRDTKRYEEIRNEEIGRRLKIAPCTHSPNLWFVRVNKICSLTLLFSAAASRSNELSQSRLDGYG